MRYPMRWLVAVALGMVGAGCGGGGAAVPAGVAPSPTISAGVPAITPSPPVAMPTELIVRPAEGSPVAGSNPGDTPQSFLWPTYIPAGFQVEPTESRVSDEHTTGVNGLGYYVVTLNSGANKLVIGGGGIEDVLPLQGAERTLSIGKRAVRLITNDDQRELVFDVPAGKLFVYSAGLSEEELLKVAASLQPIDPQVLRALAGPTQ